MKPSIKDIQTEQGKANFVSWLLREFGENEFTNSEMKKHYNEAVTEAIENTTELKMKWVLMKAREARLGRCCPPCTRRISYQINKELQRVETSFSEKSDNFDYNFHYEELVRFINPRLNFARSYTLNSGAFFGCSFFSSREENVTIRKAKAVGRVDYNFEGVLHKWSSEEELTRHFLNGKYTIEFEDIDTFRYYFRLNGGEAANYIMNQAKTAQRLREERTRQLVEEMPEEDKMEVLEYLADAYGYWLE